VLLFSTLREQGDGGKSGEKSRMMTERKREMEEKFGKWKESKERE